MEIKTGPRKWTDERVREGLARFYEENKRYPTAREFDHCSYLPNARSIQIKYSGGLPEFRQKFIPDSPLDHTKGTIRSAVAKNTIAKSYEYEERFYRLLINRFSEHLIHEQKRLRPGNVACDFFIYTSSKHGIALDLFYAAELFNLIGVINIKLKRYKQLLSDQEIYFVSIANESFDQIAINKWIERRKEPLPSNIHVVTEEEFIKVLDSLKLVELP